MPVRHILGWQILLSFTISMQGSITRGDHMKGQEFKVQYLKSGRTVLLPGFTA